jgi:hypothetical protein
MVLSPFLRFLNLIYKKKEVTKFYEKKLHKSFLSSSV